MYFLPSNASTTSRFYFYFFVTCYVILTIHIAGALILGIAQHIKNAWIRRRWAKKREGCLPEAQPTTDNEEPQLRMLFKYVLDAVPRPFINLREY